MAGSGYNLAQIQNRILFNLREDGYDPNDIAPTGSVDFPLPIMQNDINMAIGVFLSETDYEAHLQDVYVNVPVVAGLDYQLPANCIALDRLEYYPYPGSSSIVAPYVVFPRTFDEFDEGTDGGYLITETGYPIYYRVPYGTPPAMKIRFYPQPGAGNVSAGDTMNLYYTSDGTVLVNPTDYPSIPVDFHEALVSWCLSRYWPKKMGFDGAKYWEDRFWKSVHAAKRFGETIDRAVQGSIADVEGAESGALLYGYR